jgi:hypothetical protein
LIPIWRHYASRRRDPARREVALWLVWLAAGVFWGCTVAPVERQSLDWDDFRGVERLVVAPFAGAHGERLQRALFERLVLHSSLAAVYLEARQSVAAEKFADPDDARAQWQTWRPVADAVVSARTTASLADSAGADRVEVREGTGQFRQIRDVDGNWVAVEIMRTRLQRVPFIVRQATLSADFRLDHLKHAEMSFERTATASSAQKYGGDSLLPLEALPSAADTGRELAERLAAQMARDVAGGSLPDYRSPLPRN